MSERGRQLLERALALLQDGQADDALRSLSGVLADDPTDFDALNLAGVAATRLGRHDEALSYLDRAAEKKPHHAGVQNNRGIALRALGRHEEAARAYRQSLDIDPAYAPTFTNLGRAQADLNLHGDAIRSYDASLALRPNHIETLNLKARSQRRARLDKAALATIDLAIGLAPNNPSLHLRRGDILAGLERHAEALAAYELAHGASGGKFGLGSIVGLQARLCDWTNFEQRRSTLQDRISAGDETCEPFTAIVLFDDPALHLKVAREAVGKSPKVVPATVAAARDRDGRLHIGYFSADLRNHPTTHLVGEVLSRHDRQRFKVSVFAFPVGQADIYTEGVKRAVDDYHDVSGMSDADVVRLARDAGLDVAVDMMGHTKGARPLIFAGRAAPVQVNYLAFPGTTGASFVDYIIADENIIPLHERQHYEEKVAYLPGSYVSRDTRITGAAIQPSRVEEGLPDDSVVFCSFNQSAKIMPEVFADWMDILRSVEGSTLWLLDKGAIVAANLRQQAQVAGIDSDRIVFAKHKPLDQHLARLTLADLCLDTVPYNAHTTANDALFAGVPILTHPGRSFASRVCGSLLVTVGLPELIAASRQDYTEKAGAMGNDRELLARLRTRLREQRATSRLFDVARYTRDLERAFVAMHDRHSAGDPPDHLVIAP